MGTWLVLTVQIFGSTIATRQRLQVGLVLAHVSHYGHQSAGWPWRLSDRGQAHGRRYAQPVSARKLRIQQCALQRAAQAGRQGSLVRLAEASVECYGFSDFKLKGGVMSAVDEIEAISAIKKRFPQSRVTDHRINLTLYKIDEIIAGTGLEEVIAALIQNDEAEKLARLTQD